MTGSWPRCPYCGQFLLGPYPCMPWRPLLRPCLPQPFLALDEAIAQARQALGAG
jgi:hypothetical protein